MTATNLQVQYDPLHGLVLHGELAHGATLRDVPIRVHIAGSYVFRVWSLIDSGEDAPAWADPRLDLTLFGPDGTGEDVRLERFESADRKGWRATSRAARRAEATVEITQTGAGLECSLSVFNPQHPGGAPLPIGQTRLLLGNLPEPKGGTYRSAHAYGGRTHGWGELAALDETGVPFIHGCLGLAFPLVYIHDEAAARGLEIEFMLDGRPTGWLKRTADGALAWETRWALDRLLEPGQAHAVGGCLRLRGYDGRAVEQIRLWRDAATERYGIASPKTPEWARRANIIELNSHPDNPLTPFEHLDDPQVRRWLERWKDMGYNAIFTIGHNNTGTHALSPFDYDPSPESGGAVAEKQYLDWAHELGFSVFLWVTTVGIERAAAVVAEHPEWWTHRRDDSLFYAWDAHAPDFVGYAPDGDPYATGWRDWLENEVTKVIRRGYDGIFIDGCIPRASNHARWDFPGAGRDGVAGQVRDLAELLRRLRPDLAVLVEDDGLYAQGCCEVTQGRYYPVPPYFKKAYWDHGMGGGPDSAVSEPERIPPEMARDYLLIRYASMLPDVTFKEGHEGYFSEETRPWGVQMLMGGAVPKTHSQYVDDYETYRPVHDTPDPPPADRTPEHRRKGHAEFVSLLRFVRDEPLIRDVPVSLEAVSITGDPAVVGMLKANLSDGDSPRAILGLIQFADRATTVHVALTEPVDVPAVHRDRVGRPDRARWKVREVLRSFVNSSPAADATLAPGESMQVQLGPYAFRVFELTAG